MCFQLCFNDRVYAEYSIHLRTAIQRDLNHRDERIRSLWWELGVRFGGTCIDRRPRPGGRSGSEHDCSDASHDDGS